MDKTLNVYVFGNEDIDFDNQALTAAQRLTGEIPGVEFIMINPNQNLPFENGEDVIVMDVVEGIKDVKLIQNYEIEKILMPPLNTVHDFDLGFQLKYLKKLGKLGKVTIIGLPMRGVVDYNVIQSILRKLVAQDMQGS